MKQAGGEMTFIEFLGLIFTFAAAFVIVVQKLFTDRKKRKNPQAYAKEQRQNERALREMLGIEPGDAVEEEEEEDIYVPVPPPKQAFQGTALKAPPRPQQVRAAAGSYEVIRKTQVSRGAKLVGKLASRKELFVSSMKSLSRRCQCA